MKFGEMALDQADGAILAHSIRVGDGVLKKGRVLSEADLARLRSAGKKSVVAARLEPGDVAEDAAAQQIAELVAGNAVRVSAPFTGRTNIFAADAGLVYINEAALAALNAIDERVTVATVPPFTRVSAGQMIATIKIIPFAVPEPVIARTQRETKRGLVSVAPFRAHRAALILTALPGTKTQVLERRRDAVEQRLLSLGSSIATTKIVSHTTAEVQAAVTDCISAGHAPVLVFAASAIVDREDVIPAAVVAAGGSIERLGMPVDPGNLLLLARHGTTPIVGLPSCAASLKLNGFDWVLHRLMAGIEVTSADIAAMGAIGLLKEIDSRPQPRLGHASDPAETAREAPRIAALVLAAGRSTRMGAENKLLADIAGKTIVRRVVEAVTASSASNVFVVVGHQAEHVRSALAGLSVSFVTSENYSDGLSASLAAGLGALPDDTDGALIILGDMPEVTPVLLDRLIAAFAPKEGRGIVVPMAQGKRGNPVLWSREYFSEMAAISGDTGAKHLLGTHADAVVEITAGQSIHDDIDTPDALEALRQRWE